MALAGGSSQDGYEPQLKPNVCAPQEHNSEHKPGFLPAVGGIVPLSVGAIDPASAPAAVKEADEVRRRQAKPALVHLVFLPPSEGFQACWLVKSMSSRVYRCGDMLVVTMLPWLAVVTHAGAAAGLSFKGWRVNSGTHGHGRRTARRSCGSRSKWRHATRSGEA